MAMIITLNYEDIMNAADYGRRVGGRKRNPDLVNNHFIGKLGEIAFQKMLRRYGINVTIDFNDYDIGHWDNNDVQFQGWTIDVKCFKMSTPEYYIDFKKLNFREQAGQLPHYFVITRHADGLNIKSLPETIPIEICGFVDIRDFWNQKDNIRIIHAGDVLPETKIKADGEYYAEDIHILANDWTRWIHSLMTETPFSTQFAKGRHDAEPIDKDSTLGFRYSLLLCGGEARKTSIEALQSWIRQGRKVLIFLPGTEKERYQSLIDTYADYGLFQFHSVMSDDLPDLEIRDGKVIRDRLAFERLCKLSPDFNKEQYEVEHAPMDQNLIVEASAGTGKTTVMVDRIMYLLAMDETIVPSDITMITFTNDAAKNMREKIEEKLIMRYQATESQRYLSLMENLADMQISTIDSFFKKVISIVGAEVGYGVNVRVRSFTYEKHGIVRDVIDELFRCKGDEDYLDAFVLTTDRYRNLAEACWSKLNSLGYYESDIEKMDFGCGIDEKSDTINNQLKKIIIESLKRYDELRVQKNAVSLNDFGPVMENLTKKVTDKVRGRLGIKYLFVDEFQDTDNGQIQSLIWLKKHLQARLFVVGDIKQSIYRFRGAEETAFEKLKEGLGNSVKNYVLIKNYRTVKGIIAPLNQLFVQWSAHGFLEWKQDAVVGKQTYDTGGFTPKKYYGAKNLKKTFLDLLPEIDGSICVLNRKNKQVSEVAQWCREAQIPCIAKTEGGFYQEQAVLDVFHLLGAVLYSADARYMFNYLISSYSIVRPEAERINGMSGKEKDILDYLTGLANQNDWQEIKRTARMVPFFQWIRDIVDTVRPERVYASVHRKELVKEGFKDESTLEQQLSYDVEEYVLNLNKLIEILYQAFANDFASILTVYLYLLHKIQTDTEEDAVYPQPKQDGQRLVECMTVHKAKGLEWDTVMITHMTEPYIFNPSDFNSKGSANRPYRSFLVHENDNLQLGWYYRDKNHTYQNESYMKALQEEQEAVEREEARILYVALTRAKHNLYYFVPKYAKEHTWAGFMSLMDRGMSR